METAAMTTATTTAAHCIRCGQALLLLAEERTVCERCRLGRTVFPEETAAWEAEELAATPEPAPVVPCAGCGRTTVEGHPSLHVSLADGYCLGCRVQGRHLT
jgi:hypothetical protein